MASEEIFHALENPEKIERKYFIFLLKVVFWLTNTKTGLFNELKFYGNEYEFSQIFRLQNNEKNIYFEKYLENIAEASVQIETFSRETKKSKTYTLIREIPLMEEIIRRNTAENIHFDTLITDIENIKNIHKKSLIEAIRNIEAMYENIPDRPTGENPNPPGKYGETYFLSQEKCWHKGCQWLSMMNRFLRQVFTDWKAEFSENISRKNRIMIEYISEKILKLIKFQTEKNENLGIILTIIDGKTQLQCIEKNLSPYWKNLAENTTAYGFHLSAEGIDNFISQEW